MDRGIPLLVNPPRPLATSPSHVFAGAGASKHARGRRDDSTKHGRIHLIQLKSSRLHQHAARPASRIVHEEGNINPRDDIFGRLPSLRRIPSCPGGDDNGNNHNGIIRGASTASTRLAAAVP